MNSLKIQDTTYVFNGTQFTAKKYICTAQSGIKILTKNYRNSDEHTEDHQELKPEWLSIQKGHEFDRVMDDYHWLMVCEIN